jgi:vancomycin permeability regulator SanA
VSSSAESTLVTEPTLVKCVVVITGQILSHYPHSVENYPKGAKTALSSHAKEVRSIEAFTLGGVLAPKRYKSARHRLAQLLWVVAGMGIAGLAAVAGSVSFVRSTGTAHIHAESDVPKASVALVLGAQVSPDGTPSAFLAARLDLAKRLFDTGVVEMIIVSGDHLAPEFDEPTAMRDYLIRAGLPTGKVIADPGGFDTYESCLRAKRIFHLSRLIIVTQSYHLVRAVATCRALGIDATGVGDDSARQHTIAWWRGAIRDQLACVKTVIDLATRSEPMPDKPQSAVAVSK